MMLNKGNVNEKVVCQMAPPAFVRALGGVPVGNSCVQVTCVVHAPVAGPLHASLPCQRSFLSPLPDVPPLFEPPKRRYVVESTGTRVTPVLRPMPPLRVTKLPFGSLHGKAVFLVGLVFGELAKPA